MLDPPSSTILEHGSCTRTASEHVCAHERTLTRTFQLDTVEIAIAVRIQRTNAFPSRDLVYRRERCGTGRVSSLKK